MKRYFGRAASITAASKTTKYSRASLHKWKHDGCPAFAEDGTVDLSALCTWLENCGLGQRGAGEDADAPAHVRPEPVYFSGGRDFAAELENFHAEARRLWETLATAGHSEASEKWRSVYYDDVRPVVDGFIEWLESQGLAEPFED